MPKSLAGPLLLLTLATSHVALAARGQAGEQRIPRQVRATLAVIQGIVRTEAGLGSRNVIFFSGTKRTPGDLQGVPMGTAVTNRTISFGAQPFFPPGIDYSMPGPFFSLYKFDTLHACTQGSEAHNKNQNGIVFFPGALPFYRNGVLVGGLGVSGDGVEQDDFATAAGAVGFEAPPAMRADRVFDQGVRLPYIKFPRNPTD